MHYYSEQEIRGIIESVVTRGGGRKGPQAAAQPAAVPIPVEISARHVHLTQEAMERLFGPGYQLTKKRDLSQHGEFLSGERVKIVTAKGELTGVAVLGPLRPAVQVELSGTDCKALKIQAPVNLSGDLKGAGDVMLIGPRGAYQAEGAAIIAKAHIHMTPRDAAAYGVKDGQRVCAKVQSARPVTLDDVIIRVRDTFGLAMHIDLDEANAAMVTADTTCVIC